MSRATIPVTSVVADALMAGEIEGTVFRMPPIDRKDYVATNKVLEALGGKWDKRAKGHVFAADPADAIETAVVTGHVVDEVKRLQFYETPEPIARRMVELAEIEPGMVVLEPSAGHGAIADLIRPLLPGVLLCVELDPGRAKVLYGEGHQVFTGDFLSDDWREDGAYGLWDRVVMNPPFTRLQDVDHVTHAFECLSPGGRVVACMAVSFTFRADAKAVRFRELVSRYGTVEENPPNAFAASGTGVRTVLVVLDAPAGE